ncbi:MAG: NAD(P)-dependent oxidoreductase [Nitrososphaerota archaeon]
MARIGFIGLGLMGRPMAKRLLDAGHMLKVYNRSRAPVEELVKQGARAASSPKDAAEGSEYTILMLPDSGDVWNVALGEEGVVKGAAPGSIVIDMSTISPLTERRIAEELAKRGVKYLDAPVTGGTIGAEKGTLVIMVGGDYEAFNAAYDVLRVLGQKVVYMGASGSGQLTKLSNQISVALSLLGSCEALLFASKAGLDLGKVIEVIASGAGSSWQLANLGPKIVERDFRPGFKAEHLSKDLRITLEVAQELSLPLPGTALLHQLFKAVVARGDGVLGTQVLSKILEDLARHDLSKTLSGAEKS